MDSKAMLFERLGIQPEDSLSLYKSMVLMATWPFCTVSEVRQLYAEETSSHRLSNFYYYYHNLHDEQMACALLRRLAGQNMFRLAKRKTRYVDMDDIIQEFVARLNVTDDSTPIEGAIFTRAHTNSTNINQNTSQSVGTTFTTGNSMEIDEMGPEKY